MFFKQTDGVIFYSEKSNDKILKFPHFENNISMRSVYSEKSFNISYDRKMAVKIPYVFA